jgi:hypothetical protein
MTAPQKIAGFILGLAVVFVAALGIGAAAGPDPAEGATDHSVLSDEPAAVNAPAPKPPAGLSATEDGYTLELTRTRFDAGKQVPLQFRITDATGAAVTRYIDNHEKKLHLIVVRRDMAGFQHVHPTMDAAGTWSVPVDLSAGDYRVFADFIPAGGEDLTLGADVQVAGGYDPQPLPVPSPTAMVDGFTVKLTGSPKANEPSMLSFSVSRDGKPVTDLQPYLGAYGHLVALRAADLAYLHVHPMGEPGDGITPAGPEIAFHTVIPSDGDYRLFLDFKHQNVLRTAEFTLSVDRGPQSPNPTSPLAESGHGH